MVIFNSYVKLPEGNDPYPSTVKVYVSARRWIWDVEHLLLLSAN